MGDITWYNDLINPIGGGVEYGVGTCNESADALFSCETFEPIDLDNGGVALLFGAFSGHTIEFKVCLFFYHIITHCLFG